MICPCTLMPLRTKVSCVTDAKYCTGFSTVTKTSVTPVRAGVPPRTMIVFVLRYRVMKGSPRPVMHDDWSSIYEVGGSNWTTHALPGFDGVTRTCTQFSCIENADTGASYQFTN